MEVNNHEEHKKLMPELAKKTALIVGQARGISRSYDREGLGRGKKPRLDFRGVKAAGVKPLVNMFGFEPFQKGAVRELCCSYPQAAARAQLADNEPPARSQARCQPR